MTGALLACDLDRTLIYSNRALTLADGARPRLSCVEIHDGKRASFITRAAAQALVGLACHATLVPVTTRLPVQLARVQLPGTPSRYAIAANGGVLLVDGVADRSWSRKVKASLAESTPLPAVWKHMGKVCRPEWTMKLRNADGLFCYAVVRRAEMPADFVAEATAWAARRGWRLSMQGRKLYWVPVGLTKTAAVAEVAERIGADLVLAAGDSLLDVDLLEGADLGIHPRHGELFECGWSAPHVTCTQASGVLAGEQIVAWFAAQVALHQAA